uniref:Uncharacterized protein n=1 Tax=Panagrellus redivivus TaxID=6233 RepID=A0A7E4VC82_PANRE
MPRHETQKSPHQSESHLPLFKKCTYPCRLCQVASKHPKLGTSVKKGPSASRMNPSRKELQQKGQDQSRTVMKRRYTALYDARRRTIEMNERKTD